MTEPNITERMLPRFSIRRPVTVAMILLAILVVGTIAYNRIKLDLQPSGLNPPFLAVWVPYRDANPEEIVEQIVKPMEGELKTVKNLKRVFSEAASRYSWFWLEFNQGANMDVAYSQVSDRIERARPLLPAEVERIYIRRFRTGQEPVMVMGLSFDKNVEDPYYAADKFFKQALEGTKGVANIELFGLREKYVQIIVDNDKIKTYRVNLPQLMGKLMRDNFAMSNGYVYMGKMKYLLRTKSRFSSLEEIRNIEIGNGVRLENIADVTYDFDEERRSLMRIDGKLGAALEIFKESEANTVEVCRLIKKKIELQLKEHPELKGVDYFVFWDMGNVIDESIGNVQTTMMWGAFFAFFVLLLFLRKIRITTMLTLAIPLSILISLLGIYALGWTLNAITMMGMMISIGLVVDNSIVITENIYRLNGQGIEKKRAAVLGSSEVGLAIIMATMTTIVVFLPLMVMTGNSILSFFLIRIGVPVIFAILGSLLIALILIPLASLKTIPPRVQLVQATHNRITQWYQTFLVKILKHRFDAIIVILLLFLSMFFAYSQIKKADEAEGGPRDAKVICTFPSHYNVDKVDKVMNYIYKKLMEKKDVYHIDHVSARSFNFYGRLDIYLEPDPDTQWYEVIYRKIANSLGWSNYHRLSREELSEDIKKILPVIPGVKMRTTWSDDSQGGEDSFNYVITGYDMGVLAHLADELEKQLLMEVGVLSVETGVETGNDEIHISVDRDKTYNAGTNPNYLGQLVRFNLGRRKISNYQLPDREIEIYVKTKPKDRQSVAQLKNTFIKTDSGTETSLDSIADLTYHKSVGQIRREYGKTSLELKIFTAEEDTKKMGARLERVFKRFKMPTGYSYSKGGRQMRFMDQDDDMMRALLFAVILVFLIMGVLFESFILPLSVIIAIPAAFVGSFWLLLLTGTTFEVMAGIGLVVLIGVVVNNAIVLIDLINQYRNSGMQREQAILVAGVHRLRPILMTALTTIFGLMPMAVGKTGLVGIPYTPMGVTLIGGLISSTFLTLFAVPVFYTYFDDLRHFFPRFLKRF